ncbi:MAG: RluA family pseudouridine synthase [bacterium]|nr:RluA family pseudouridine synthase [bacterium]
MKKLTVPETAKGKRLDRFLTEQTPEKSRSWWQKELKAQRVFVDGKVAIPHLALKGGEGITFEKAPKIKKLAPPSLDIMHEEDDFLIINKPPGLLVHPTDTSTEPTLVDALIAYNKKIASVGDPLRPGIVHRLDRPVSGVMVIAKTPLMFDHLRNQFTTREMHKEYVALVFGIIKKDIGEINFPIGRSKKDGRMAARPEDEEGKPAKTEFEVVKRFSNSTLLHVTPETGRTHQIRAHLFAYDHPIVGDPVYRPRARRHRGTGPEYLGKALIPRIMLHAEKLTFTDLQGKMHHYESPLPEDFAQVLNQLK